MNNAKRNAEIKRLYDSGLSFDAVGRALNVSRNVVAGSLWRGREDRPALKGHARGERGWNAKLTAARVVELRERRAGGETVSALAVEFGIAQSTASLIVNGHRWAHVPLSGRALVRASPTPDDATRAKRVEG